MKTGLLLAVVSALAVGLYGLTSLAAPMMTAKPVAEATGSTVVPPEPGKTVPIKVSLSNVIEKNGKYVVKLDGGREAVLSLDPRLQKKAESFLKSNRVAFGAVVAIEPSTGRVLAYADHSEFDPEFKYYNISKPYRAASLFKIITAEAILTEKKVPLDEVLCYHGGKRRLNSKLLEDNPRRDNRCLTFEQAMGHSTNVVFARLAHKNLTPDILSRHAKAFMFDMPIPFELDVEPSVANIPADPEEMAIAAAGFGDVKVSPLHAAMIAATVANDGVMMRPFIIDEVRGADGTRVLGPSSELIGKVSTTAVAETLSSMMYMTTTEGTARKAFRHKRGKLDFKHDIPIAGKTGSLADREPFYHEYTWYTGFGPVDDPRIAVAALVINHRTWNTKGSYAAREIFEEFFKSRGAVAQAVKSRRMRLN
jgi:cell division protein FtsI/penicillin-binding protein 2